MAKYECKVCGYIYNEQHAGRTFDELTECPICNEGKENFIALDADNNPIEAVKEEVKEAEDFVEEVKAEDNFFEEVKEDAKDEETAADFYEEVKEDVVAKAAEEPFSMYKEIKEDADVITAPESEFVVERRQDFWTPVSANAEKKEEPVSNNTTGWTISNAMGSVEKVIGGEEPAEEVKESVAEEIAEEVKEAAMEDDDMPAFNSRIESFYSSAEPVGTSHIITEEEEEDNFRPLWNSGGGTVQRVIDPFNDKNDSVVKAENIGMVMPAEEPVVEEILGEEEPIETEAVAEESVSKEIAEEAEVVDIFADDEDEFAVEDAVEEIVETVDETVEEAEESDVEDSALFPEEALEEEGLNEESAEVVDYLDEDDDDFFTEMTMDAMMGMEEEHHHGDSSISEEEVFSAIDAIEFDDDVPEGGRIEVVSADGVETIELDDAAEEVAEEAVEELTEKVVEEPEEIIVEDAVEEDEPFFFEEAKEEDADEELFANFEDAIEDNVHEVASEDMEEMLEYVADEKVDEAVEEVAEEVEETAEEIEEAAEDILEETIAETEEDDEPFFFEEIDDIPTEVTEDDFVTEEEVAEKADAVEETVAAEDAVEATEEVKADAEETKEEAPVIKGWSFLDDVVEAGVATGATVAGVNFVTKAMDEVVDEEVTDEDIEEVFVDFAEKVKDDANEHEFKANLAEELFAQEPVAFKEDVPLAEQCDSIEDEKKEYCNNLEKILIVPAQLNPMPLPEGTEVEGRTILGITSERPLVLDNSVFSTGDYNMVQYIPNSGLTSEDYQQADAIEIIVGHGNGIEKTINSKEDLRQVVNFLRLESDGCPIGIKMAASRIERDLEFCVFAKPDYVVLNNFDVVPLPYALHRATKFLNTVQSSMDIVIALDGAKDAEELAKIMAMGADVIALRNRPDDMIKMAEGLKKYARITGHYDVEDLNVKDLCTIDREIAEFTDIYHV